MQTTNVLRTFSLINQPYSPDDALEMLSGMVQEYTRQQNIRILQSWEHDHCFNS